MSDNNLFKNIVGEGMREADSGPLKALKARPFVGSASFRPNIEGAIKSMKAKSIMSLFMSPGVDKSDVTKLKAKTSGRITPAVNNARRPVIKKK